MLHVSNGSCSTKATYYVTCDKSQSVVPNLSIKSFTSSCTFIWYRADLSSCTRFGSAASDGSVRTASSHWFSPSAEYQANGSTYIPRHRYRLRFASWLWITVLVLWLNYYMNETIFDFTYSGGWLTDKVWMVVSQLLILNHLLSFSCPLRLWLCSLPLWCVHIICLISN